MKRLAIFLLMMTVLLCGCSALKEVIAPAENNVVADEQDVFVYDSDSGEEVPGTEIPIEEYKKAFEEETSSEPVETEQESASPTEDEESEVVEEEKVSPTVYRTKSGEKYHRSGCYYLKSKIETTVDRARAMGLKPCSKCRPPQ